MRKLTKAELEARTARTTARLLAALERLRAMGVTDYSEATDEQLIAVGLNAFERSQYRAAVAETLDEQREKES